MPGDRHSGGGGVASRPPRSTILLGFLLAPRLNHILLQIKAVICTKGKARGLTPQAGREFSSI